MYFPRDSSFRIRYWHDACKTCARRPTNIQQEEEEERKKLTVAHFVLEHPFTYPPVELPRLFDDESWSGCVAFPTRLESIFCESVPLAVSHLSGEEGRNGKNERWKNGKTALEHLMGVAPVRRHAEEWLSENMPMKNNNHASGGWGTASTTQVWAIGKLTYAYA